MGKEGTKARRHGGTKGGAVAAMFGVLMVFASSAFAQTSRPARAPTIRDAVRMLVDEAKTAKKAGQLSRTRANFADDFAVQVPPDVVAERIARRASSDPFIDAYVRWQLTSFDPPLPDMRDREFKKFVTTLPKFNSNPRAEKAMLARLDAIRQSGRIRGADETRIATMLKALAAKASVAEALNKPAGAFRDWVLEQLKSPERRLTVTLERCASRVDAAWNVEQLKNRVHTTFTQAASDESLSAEGRTRIAAQARRLIGRRRAYLARAAVDNGVLIMEVDEAAVYDFEVARWIRAMRPEPEPQ